MSTVAFWIMLHIPTGAGWRYSRFRLVRVVGGWWLPRWYSLATAAENWAAKP